MTPAYERKDVLVSLKDINLSFDGKSVLNGLSAEVRDIVRPGCVTGQILGILGPSGIGKTQLSRIMTGLQKPTSGQVLVGAGGVPVQAGLVGYVAQKYPLLRHRTILGNLVLAARQSGAGKGSKDKAMEYLKKFDLAEKWDQYPAQLSGGQQQRVAIAQQLLCSEHFLILDEPTTGLDPVMKDRVCDLVKTVSGMAEENTIFVVTHDIASILTIADTLWLLGRVKKEDGTPDGARIVQTYDLIDRGLAWKERPQDLPAYVDLQREIRNRFETL